MTSPFYQEPVFIDKPLRLVGAASAPGCAGGRATLFQQRPPVALAQARCAVCQRVCPSTNACMFHVPRVWRVRVASPVFVCAFACA